MSKRRANNIASLIIMMSMLIKCMGFKESISLLYYTLKSFNSVLLQLSNTSVISYVLKYYITFPIVGSVLSCLGSPRGKQGHLIGKILYFIIGYIVCLILDFFANVIF